MSVSSSASHLKHPFTSSTSPSVPSEDSPSFAENRGRRLLLEDALVLL